MKENNLAMISDIKTEIEDNEWDEEVNWRYEKWDEELKGEMKRKMKSEIKRSIKEMAKNFFFTSHSLAVTIF